MVFFYRIRILMFLFVDLLQKWYKVKFAFKFLEKNVKRHIILLLYKTLIRIAFLPSKHAVIFTGLKNIQLG